MTATYNSLKGTTYQSFQIGKDGIVIWQGTTAPASNIGNDGDIYIRSGTLPRFYQHVNGSWVQLESTQKVIKSVNYNYQTSLPDQVIFVDTTTQAVTVTLGNTCLVAGNEIVIKDSGGNAAENVITIICQGGQNIDGQSSMTVNYNYESVTLMSDGNNWFTV